MRAKQQNSSKEQQKRSQKIEAAIVELSQKQQQISHKLKLKEGWLEANIHKRFDKLRKWLAENKKNI